MTDHRPASDTKMLLSVVLAGAVLLLVVHSLGRFIYTPLLPYLVADGMLTATEGVSVATWNYLGYLIGALLAIRWYRPDQIRLALPVAMGVHVITTLAQTQVDSTSLLAGMRLVNGVANGVEGLRIVEQAELRQMEPNINDNAVAALYAIRSDA